MQWLSEIFDMPLFPHLYMIPIVFVAGVMTGMQIKKIDESEEELLPPKPTILED
ncbi:MAG: hypothetical protein R3A45_06430 [Bdellovibrionota bacterium]|nr:hypothetical protein [Deltaproteobacteria bacterium]